MNKNMKRLSLTAFCLLLVACVVILGERAALAGGPPDELYAACVNPDDRAAIRAERNLCDDHATGNFIGNPYNVGIFRPCTPPELEAGSGSCELESMCSEVETDRYLCLGAPGTDDDPCVGQTNGSSCELPDGGSGSCCEEVCLGVALC